MAGVPNVQNTMAVLSDILNKLAEYVVLKDLIAVLALIVSIAGLFFAAHPNATPSRTERGKFFKESYSPFFLDDQIRYVYEQIEAGAPIFRNGFGTGDMKEQIKRQRAMRRSLPISK